jgi:SAM-dependent methyltransferase
MAAAAAVGTNGTVLGVDLSTDELDVARVRAAQRGIGNVAFREADASADDLGPDRHDVLTSRFGVMFFADPVAAFTHLRGALRPGGRLAFVCWQSLDANEWTTVPRQAIDEVLPLAPPPAADTPGEFAFGDPDRVRSVLDGAGWTDIELTDVERTVHLGASIDEAVAFVRQMDYAKAVLDPAPPALAAEAVDRVRAALATRAGTDGAIDLPGRVWVVRARTWPP